MTVISLSITESAVQIIDNIPKYLTVEANIISTIFYTVDGTDPDTNSLILINPLLLPTDSSQVVVKLWATDGVNSSAIITKTYTSSTTGLRNPHDRVSGLTVQATNTQDPYPFGSINVGSPVQFGNVGGEIVDAAEIVGIPDGYAGLGDGTIAGETDKPLDQYQFIYSTTNKQGLRVPNVGTLPAQVSIVVPPPAPDSSNANQNTKLFNPRALVIFQDGTQDPEDEDIVHLNRGYFTLDDVRSMDGGLSDTTTFTEGGNIPYGSLIRQQFNPRDNTITYYYRCQLSGRWVISKEPYVAKNTSVQNLANIVFSSKIPRNVFVWIPLMRSTVQFV